MTCQLTHNYYTKVVCFCCSCAVSIVLILVVVLVVAVLLMLVLEVLLEVVLHRIVAWLYLDIFHFQQWCSLQR